MNRGAGRSGAAPHLDGEVRGGEHAPHGGHGARAAAGRQGDASVGDGTVTAASAVGEACQGCGDAAEQPLGEVDVAQHLMPSSTGGPGGDFAGPRGSRGPHRCAGGDGTSGSNPLAAPDPVIGLFKAGAAGLRRLRGEVRSVTVL